MAKITNRNDKFTRLMFDRYMNQYGKIFDCERDANLSNVFHISCRRLGINDITVRIMYPARDSHNNIKGNSTVINNIEDIKRTGVDHNTLYIFTDANGNLYEVPGNDLYKWCVDKGMDKGIVKVSYTPDKKYIIDKKER